MFSLFGVVIYLTAVAGEITELQEKMPELTCYTCVEAPSNSICNQYAVDRPCSEGLDFCQTVHVMNSTRETILVTKRCVTKSECINSRVGCVNMESFSGQKCTSCCDENRCNDFVPTNETTAVLQQRSGTCIPLNASSNYNIFILTLTLLWTFKATLI